MCPRFETKRISFPSGRPGRADFVIVLAVVVARKSAAVLAGQALDVFQFAVAELSDEDVEASVERSGNEGDPLAIGRETRLQVDCSTGRELLRAFRFQVQGPEFDRIVGIGRIHHPASVGRAIGLVVIARARRSVAPRPWSRASAATTIPPWSRPRCVSRETTPPRWARW